jgi:hypothetical protein
MNIPIRVWLLAGIMALAVGAGPRAKAQRLIVIEPIRIEAVDVRVGETRPAQVLARVTGALGDGCDHLHAIEPRREGRRVEVRITRTHYTGGPCTKIYKEFSQELGLPGSYARGTYTLRVNNVTRRFTVR